MTSSDWLLANGIVPYADLISVFDDALAAQRTADEAAMYHAVRKHMPRDFPLDIVSEAIRGARIELENGQ